MAMSANACTVVGSDGMANRQVLNEELIESAQRLITSHPDQMESGSAGVSRHAQDSILEVPR